MLSSKSRPAAFFLLFSIPLLAQQPTIDAIVNGASYASVPGDLPGFSPGSVATIFGSNLASQTLVVAEPLHPVFSMLGSLGGTHVFLRDSGNLPLFSVSPNRIDFQIPWNIYSYSRPFTIAV